MGLIIEHTPVAMVSLSFETWWPNEPVTDRFRWPGLNCMSCIVNDYFANEIERIMCLFISSNVVSFFPTVFHLWKLLNFYASFTWVANPGQAGSKSRWPGGHGPTIQC